MHEASESVPGFRTGNNQQVLNFSRNIELLVVISGGRHVEAARPCPGPPPPPPSGEGKDGRHEKVFNSLFVLGFSKSFMTLYVFQNTH